MKAQEYFAQIDNNGLTGDDLEHEIVYYSNVVKRNPYDGLAYYNLAVAKMFKRNLDGATANYEKLIELNSMNGISYSNLGTIQNLKNEDGRNRATLYLNKAIAIKKKCALPYCYLGKIKLANSDYKYALENYDKANQLDSKITETEHSAYIAKITKSETLQSRIRYIKLYHLMSKLLNKITIKKRETSNNTNSKSAYIHYGTSNTLKNIAQGERLHLHNANNMEKYHEEGLVMSEILKEKGIQIETGDSANRDIFIGSLTSDNINGDDASMWKRYGEDGRGCALVFEKGPEEPPDPLFTGMDKQFFNSENYACTSRECFLYPIIYKEEVLKDDEILGTLMELGCLVQKIQSLINGTRENKEKLKKLVIDILDSVRFLFKSQQFLPENETRLMVIRHKHSATVRKYPNSQKVYIECPLIPYRIILGSTVATSNEWINRLKEKYKEHKIREAYTNGKLHILSKDN